METENKPQEEISVKPSIVQEALATKEELEKLAAETKQLLKEMQDARAEAILSGKADAGTVPEVPKQKTPIERSRELFEGKMENPFK